MAYSSPATVVTATTITSAWGNSVKAATDYLANPPACRVTNNAVQSIANAAWTALTFNTELFDTNSMHDTVTNTSRITITTAGLYTVSVGVAFAANATGGRACGVRKNGTGTTGPTEGGVLIQAVTVTDGTYVGYAVTVKLAAADYIEAVVFQRSGGALNSSVSDGLPVFSATWIGLG